MGAIDAPTTDHRLPAAAPGPRPHPSLPARPPRPASAATMDAPVVATSYEDERAGQRGGMMEKLLAKRAGDDSEERERARRAAAKRKMRDQAVANRKLVLKTMLFEDYEEHLIDRRINAGVITDFGWKRLHRQRMEDHMTGDMPVHRDLQLRRWKPTKPWPGRHQMSQEEQELARLEGDTGTNLRDGTALAKASAKVHTSLPMYSEGLRLHRVVQVSTGYSHTLVLTAVGVVLSYGNGLEGQLGHGDRTSRPGPRVLHALTGIPVVGGAAGLHHSCVIAEPSLKKVFTFGKNNRGQLGLGAPGLTGSRAAAARRRRRGGGGLPTPPRRSGNQEDDDGGGGHSNGENAGDAHNHVHGGGADGTFSPKSLPRSTRPMLVQHIWGSQSLRMRPAQVSAGNYHTCVVDVAGAVFSWGDNRHGQLGIGVVASSHVHNTRPAPNPGLPRRVAGPLGAGDGRYPVDHVSCGAFHTAVCTTSGTCYCVLVFVFDASCAIPLTYSTRSQTIQVPSGRAVWPNTAGWATPVGRRSTWPPFSASTAWPLPRSSKWTPAGPTQCAATTTGASTVLAATTSCSWVWLRCCRVAVSQPGALWETCQRSASLKS